RLDCAAAFFHEATEEPEAKCRIERIETQGMLANVVVRIAGQVDDSEQSHVFKRQVTSAVEVEHRSGKAGIFRRIAVVGEVAGHPEVQMQPIAFARLGKEMFAMPANGRELLTGQSTDERRFSRGSQNPFIEHAHACDPLPQPMTLEVARVDLHFRQLRHGAKCTMTEWLE